MILNMHTLQKELKEPYLERSKRLAPMEQTGVAEVALNEGCVGKIERFPSTALRAHFPCLDLMDNGNAPNWTTKLGKFVQNTSNTNRSRRNRIAMAFEKTKQEFHALSKKRSEQLRQIKQCENDIVSITERLDSLNKQDDGSQEFIDQFSKAKDKRRRLRDEVADLEHDVRMTESEIKALMMEYQFLVDLESTDDE